MFNCEVFAVDETCPRPELWGCSGASEGSARLVAGGAAAAAGHNRGVQREFV